VVLGGERGGMLYNLGFLGGGGGRIGDPWRHPT